MVMQWRFSTWSGNFPQQFFPIIKCKRKSAAGETGWTCTLILEHASARACKCDRVCGMAQAPEGKLYTSHSQRSLQQGDINGKSVLYDRSWKKIKRGVSLNICTHKTCFCWPDIDSDMNKTKAQADCACQSAGDHCKVNVKHRQP